MALPRVRTVCFDFDKTLGYMSPSHFSVYVGAAAEFGVSVTEADLAATPLDDAWAPWETPDGPDHADASRDESTFRIVREELHRARLLRAGVDCPEPVLASICRRIAELECDPRFYRLYDDTIPALDRLARSGLQSVVISNHVWRLPEILRAIGLGGRLEGVLTSARVGVRKPHRRIFEQALLLAGSAPEDTLMVGDSLAHDVEGARRAGLRAVLLDREGTREPVEGVQVIRSLMEIPLEWT